jgi:FixJ family two-component response regulator
VSGYGHIPIAVEAIKAGVADFIEKPLDKRSFVGKVKTILSQNGNHKQLCKPLTQSEQKVLQLVLDGKSNKEIADLLSRSHRTIDVHRAHIMQKIRANSLVDPIKQTAEMGLVKMSRV